MSIEGRESPRNTGLPRAPPPSIESPGNTGLPSTPPPSFGSLPFDMKNYTFSTRRNQSNLDTASTEGLSGSLQANPPIFSLSLGGVHGNVTDEMEISPWDVKTAPASSNEHLSREQNSMMKVERLKLELERTHAIARQEREHTQGMLYVIARQEATKANIKANELTKQIRKEIARQLAEREEQHKRDTEIRARMESEVKMKAQKAVESKQPYVQTRYIKEEMAAMPPQHFFCPILQEVMDDPHIAADGFTYEYSFINNWLENKINTSPMTNQTLDNKFLIPNHALRFSILEWKIKSGFNNADYNTKQYLEKDVLPELERFEAFADAQSRHIREEIDVMPPSHFFCPILKEVMDDPHTAADGFTYEYSIINTWLENKNTSPMTNQTLDNKFLIPNHALRSAILEWKVEYQQCGL